MKPELIIKWLSPQRYESLPAELRDTALNRVCETAPDVPTAAIWLLQQCGILPSTKDLTRWSRDVSKKSRQP